MSGTALAIRDEQDYWDDKQLAVLHQTGIGEDVSKAEMASFLHECQRRKLDPFTRQIYLIGRFDRRAGRVVYRSQTSIDGFRLIARRAADRSGVDYAYEDTIWFDDKGARHEVWLSDKPPAAAKVVVVRNGNRHDAVARHSAYVPTDKEGKPTGLWRSMPDTMIAKCAEALALRKAFPEDLGGLYAAEEMAQADGSQPAPAVTATVVTEPAKPNGNGNGHAAGKVSRPAQRAEQPAADLGEVDKDAQQYADEATEARTLDALRKAWTAANQAKKLSAPVVDTGTGEKLLLSRLIEDRRKYLAEVDAALQALTEAGGAAGLEGAGELDEQVRKVTGAGIEEATAAQLREAAKALKAEAAA